MRIQNWFDYLKAGLSRTIPHDKLKTEMDGANTRSRLRNLQPYLARHWRKGVMGASLIFFVSLLTFPQPLINRFLIDDVMLARRLDLLPVALILMGGIKLLSMGAGIAQQYYFTHFEQNILRDLQQNLLDHVLRLPKSFFDDKEVGYLISRVSSDVWGLRWFFSSNIVYLVSGLFRFVGGMLLLFYLEWRLGIVTLIVLPLLVFSARYFANRMRALYHHGREKYADITQRFEETLSSVPLIKAFASEQRESRRIMSEVNASQQIEMEQSTVSSVANLILDSVPGIAGAVALVIGAYWVIQGEWTLGSLLAFQSYLGYVHGPALSLANANLQFQSALTALERVSAVLDVVPEENSAIGRVVTNLQGDVRFENVSFSYNGQDKVLEDVSFHVRPGRHVAIVGSSGVGKTTLVSLILRFYQPTHGNIFFDGAPASDYELQSLRKRIGYVSQSTILLAGTIRENLCYGAPEALQEDIEEAARLAGIHDFICSLPGGYDSLVGERGVNLSEGQKQRLSIARALVKVPDILILDEPTSALDGSVEKSIFDALPSVVRKKTLFIVAHRPSTIQHADGVLFFSEKRLVAVGTHKELQAGNAHYRSLFL